MLASGKVSARHSPTKVGREARLFVWKFSFGSALSNLLSERIEALVNPPLQGLGYATVLVKLTEAHKRRTLQLFIERLDEKPIRVEDCTEVSHLVSALLDVHDPIEGNYDLEVSSPGIDRPLVKIADFVRFTGQQARIDLSMALDGRKRFSGVIMGVEGEDIEIKTADGKQFFLPHGQIATAKLVLTDALIKAHADAVKKAEITEEGMSIPSPVNDNAQD